MHPRAPLFRTRQRAALGCNKCPWRRRIITGENTLGHIPWSDFPWKEWLHLRSVRAGRQILNHNASDVSVVALTQKGLRYSRGRWYSEEGFWIHGTQQLNVLGSLLIPSVWKVGVVWKRGKGRGSGWWRFNGGVPGKGVRGMRAWIRLIWLM